MKNRQIILLLILVFVLVLTSGCAASNPESTEKPVVKPTEATGKPLAKEEPELVWSHKHGEKLESVAVSPDGETLAVGEYLTAYIHRLADGEVVDVLTFDHSVEDMEYSPDGTLLAAGLSVYGVSLHDVNGETDPLQLHGGYNNRLCFSPDGEIIATSNRNGDIWLWQVEDGEQIASLEAENKKHTTSLDYHPSGNLIAAAKWTDEGDIQIWDIAQAQIVHTLTLDVLLGSMENPFVFSPDGEIMAGAVRVDRTPYVRLWTVDGAETIADLEVPKNVKDLAFSPDGSLLAVISQQAVTVLDVASQTLLYTFDQTIDPDVSDWNKEGAFTPDGGHVAVARWDGTIELWRLPGADPIPLPPVDMRVPPPLPSDVLFDTGSAELKEAANAELESFANELYASFTKAKIKFIGHTDSRGDAKNNLQLSLDRATAIKKWFETWADEKEIDGWTLLVDGKGETELKAPDTNVKGTFLEDAGALNRRVEIEIEPE
jgi:outer membrane protein OmpA-like peptidoglycan-associated protein